VQWMHRGNLP